MEDFFDAIFGGLIIFIVSFASADNAQVKRENIKQQQAFERRLEIENNRTKDKKDIYLKLVPQ